MKQTMRMAAPFLTAFIAAFGIPTSPEAAIVASTLISFDESDFVVSPVRNQINSFSFAIEVNETLEVGSYIDPVLGSVNYTVNGTLTETTPSGFPGFQLVRNIGGTEFYDQGSSLSFIIAPSANLTDGLQIEEFSSFTFNGREVDTGRYHPPLLEFTAAGSGSIRNSNNTGGINPGNDMLVDVDFGEEYVADLSFTPMAVPIPAVAYLFPTGLIAGIAWMRRKAH